MIHSIVGTPGKDGRDDGIDPEAFARDQHKKQQLLNKWQMYFPLEPPKPYDVSPI